MNISENVSRKCFRCKKLLTLDHYEKNKKKELFKSCNCCRAQQREDNNFTKHFTAKYRNEWMDNNKDKYKEEIKELSKVYDYDEQIYTYLRSKYDPIPGLKTN